MKKGIFCVVTLFLTMMFAGFSNNTSIFTETVYAAVDDDFDDDFDEDDDDFEDEDDDDDEVFALPEIGTTIYDAESNAWYQVIDIEDETALLEYVKSNNAAASAIEIPEYVEADDDIYEVTKVANNAFLNNKAITKVLIGDCVRSIGSNAFKGCSRLTTVTMGEDLQVIGTSAFEGCSKLKNLTFGESVSTIGDKAFKKCVSLTKLTITKSISKIGKQAFCGNKQLKNVTIQSTKYTAKTFGKQAFKDIHHKAVIKVPAKKLAAYRQILKNAGLAGKSQKVK